MRRVRHVLLGTTAVGMMVAAVVAAPTIARAPLAHAAACIKVTNLEAIIDDSGSMASTDPNTLRVKGLKLLINTLSPSTFMGAVEFGTSADTVFKPEAIGPNATAMAKALDQRVQADNGSTDYNAAFAQSDADNPNGQARIFLTDGGHNAGDYLNGHLVHTVPTYVIGFSPGLAAPTDQQRLQQIAHDTGGFYIPLTDSSQLQSVMNNIGAALTCQAAPSSFTDRLAQGASRTHSLTLASGTRSVQIALTWSSPLDRFTLSNLQLVVHGKTVAVAARTPRRLKVKKSVSQTFTLLKVSGLKAGKLKFKVTATRVGSGFGSTLARATLTTQVSQRRR